VSTYARRRPQWPLSRLATMLMGLGVGICLLLAFVVAVTAGRCDGVFAIPQLCNFPIAVGAALTIAAVPLVVRLTARRPIAWLFAAYIVLVPINEALFLSPSLTVTKILGIVLAVVAIATVVWKRAPIRLPGAVFAWAAVVALMTLSIVWGVAPALSLPTIITISSEFALLAVIVATPLDREDLRAVIIATIASGAVVGVVALVSGQHELSTIEGSVGRLYLNLGTATLDPDLFGAALLLPVAMTVGAFGQTKGWQRIGLLALLLLTLTAVYLTASRGTVLALIAMAIVGIAATRHRVALTAALLAGVALMFAIPNEVTSRFLAQDVTGLSTGDLRLDIWRVALPIFRGHWLLGTGVGTFPAAYDRAFFAAYQPQFAGWTVDPHGLLISTSTELGVVGIIFVGVALIMQYRSVRFIGPDHPYPWLRAVFTAAFLGLLVSAFFVDVMAKKFAWLLFTEMLLAARFGMSTRSFNRGR
jgi:putative inorganic carbon (hco3(-)) transporter